MQLGLNGIGKAGLTTHASPPEVKLQQGKVSSCVFFGAGSVLAVLDCVGRGTGLQLR